MASDSPGGYHQLAHYVDGGGHVVVGGGGHRDCKDSGYYVSTSDGASTCSSSATEAGDFEGGTLLVLEPKSLRSFTTNDEYLYAMKEDLADWFSCLYQTVITAESFMAMLETGVLLCKHANKMQEFARERREKGETLEMRSYFIRYIPEGNVPYKEGVKPETFQARDNVSNFIKWGRQMGIPEVLSFETDDLVLRKNEKSVILCLLEIARVGAKLGMLAPTLVQMEEEIDAELAGDVPLPRPQIQTCDMRSLDERVRDLIRRCTCPVQFPMVKVGEGKYKIGDSRSLIFVRILRNHVMVRVGGGWDTLENYLNKHDPCQCNYRGHRPSSTTTNQQRKPSTTNYSVNRPAPNTPTSPRRNIQQSSTASHHDRPCSPQLPAQPSRSKSPTLIISRHVLQGDAKGGAKAAPKAPLEQCNSRAPERSGSPSTSSRMRSPSPGIVVSAPAQVYSGGVRSSPAARQYKAECDVNRFRHPSSSMSRSISLDDHTEMHTVPKSLLSTLDHVSESGSTSSLDSGGVGGRTNVNMDKISTMTLSEFKSLLQSSITVPEGPKPGTGNGLVGQGSRQESLRDKERSIRDSLSSKASARRASSCSGRPNGSQTPDEDSVCFPATDRPKTPQASRRNVAISRPKTPTSLGTYRPKTPNGSSEKNGQREEYRMARPKTPSQIKRDAVAKVAGAISNWVESRNEMDSRPKTPTRHKAPLASHSEQWDADSSDEDDSSIASTLSKSQLQALSSTVKERPSTPSRIPKPCFASRPNTPKSVLSDNNMDESSSSKSFQQSRPSNISISRPQLLSRSSSNASSIRSEDNPPSPSGSQGDEKSLRLSRPTTIISRKQQTPTRDVQNARRAITPGSGSSVSGLAVTPGPREKWSIGYNGGCDVVDAKRRGSLDVCWSNKSRPPENQTNSTQDAYFELPITNEITFSDDEEINELVKNAALSAMASNKNRVRSSSVDARKLARRSAKDKLEETIIIHRDNSGSHGVQVKRDDVNVDSKPTVVRRPPSADPVLRYRALTPDSSKYHQKISASKPSKVANQDSGDKSINRTEAWVDSTLADPKRKQAPHPKRPKCVVNDIPASDLEPRPLEEIKALLSEPKNGFVQVNTEALNAPPEDPELYKKMEKLFEKYREMELRASVYDTPGGSKVDKNSDPNLSKVSGNKLPKPSLSIASGKTSSESCASSSGMSSGNPNGINSSKSSEDNRFKRSSSVPLSFQNATMTVSHHDEKLGSGGGSEHSLQGSLKDIDSEIAKNPTALVSVIKEILKVRPRKDGNTEIPTRIPGPSSLNRNGRSKSVTNLYSNRLSSCDEEALEEGLTLSPRIKSDSANAHLEKSNSTSNSNIAYSEFFYTNPQEEAVGLNRTWSARSDSGGDGQGRSETPAPKLATPLTTGRSTLLQKKPDKMSRSLSQEKDIYYSNSSSCSRSAYSATNDESELL